MHRYHWYINTDGSRHIYRDPCIDDSCIRDHVRVLTDDEYYKLTALANATRADRRWAGG